MAMAVIIFLCIIFCIICIQLFGGKVHGKKRYHPIAGTVIQQLINFSRLHDYMTDLAGKYKTYRLIAPLRSEVYTSDPANVEYMLKTNFPNYAKGWHNYSILNDLLGEGIFTVDGEKWREQRKVSSYEFSTRVLRDFSSVIFKNNVVKLANIVSASATRNEAMDIQDLFMKATLDSIFKVAFGVDLDTMCGSKEGAKFSNAFDDASALTLWRYVDMAWKIKRALNLGSEAKLKRNVRVIDDFVYKLISSKIEKMNTSHDDPSIQLKKDDILSRFLEVTETDPKYLRDIILNFIIAGKDTTATTLAWFIYMICKHPRVQEEVAKEIQGVTDSNHVEDISEFASNLSEDALEKMHYLHAALTETLRLYPSICNGKDGIHMGDDALDYKPERWLDKNGCFRQESPFKFTAFQAGPRICLGKEFAYRQMKIFAAVLLRFFIFKLGDERQTVKYRTMINLHIDGGLSVRSLHRTHTN